MSGALYAVKMARCRICGVTLYEPSEEEYREKGSQLRQSCQEGVEPVGVHPVVFL